MSKNTIIRSFVRSDFLKWIVGWYDHFNLTKTKPSSMSKEFEPQFKLNIGEKAPDFLLHFQDGTNTSLHQIKAEWTVFFFYPQDDSPTCTKQACNIRDHYQDLNKLNCRIYGISPDDEMSHNKFILKYQLPFPLIADHDQNIAKSLGVWSRKKFMGKVYDGIHRSSFIFDADKKLKGIIYPVKSAVHHEQILELIKSK